MLCFSLMHWCCFLSSSSERFIQNVLKNVGRQHVDVDSLTQHDLDQLSSLITNALQVVDKDQGQTAPGPRPGPRDLEGEVGEEKVQESTAIAPTAQQGTFAQEHFWAK